MLERSNEHIPHAILFSGGTFEQKSRYVFDLAKKLLGDATWDLLVLPREETDAIKIDDIRIAIQHLSQTSHQGGNKVVILLKADSMPIGASNALLKILEEPPKNSYLFLVSEYPRFLKATIRSRCQKVNFPSVKKPAPDLTTLLKNIKANKISVFEAAEKYAGAKQASPLLEILDGLYYATIEEGIGSAWCDILNQARQQVLNKQNPNRLLMLEYLFYQWKKLT